MDKKDLAKRIDQFELDLKRVGCLIDALHQIPAHQFANEETGCEYLRSSCLLQNALTYRQAIEELLAQKLALHDAYLNIRCEIFASAFER